MNPNEGIEAKNEKELLIANTPKEFAKRTIQLLKDPKLQGEIASNGKKFLKKYYFPDKINKELQRIIENGIHNRKTTRRRFR